MFQLQVKVFIQTINIYFHLHAQYTQKLLYTLLGLVIKSPHLACTDFFHIKCDSCNQEKIFTYTKFKEYSSNGSILCSLSRVKWVTTFHVDWNLVNILQLC
jgi:hypothetical protein